MIFWWDTNNQKPHASQEAKVDINLGDYSREIKLNFKPEQKDQELESKV